MHRDDAQSLIHLVGLGARSVRGLVQETHMAVHDSVVREMARVFGPAARRIGGLHGAHLSGIYKVVDLGLQAASAAGVAVAALEPPAHRDRARPAHRDGCLLYTSPSPRDGLLSRMPSSA